MLFDKMYSIVGKLEQMYLLSCCYTYAAIGIIYSCYTVLKTVVSTTPSWLKRKACLLPSWKIHVTNFTSLLATVPEVRMFQDSLVSSSSSPWECWLNLSVYSLHSDYTSVICFLPGQSDNSTYLFRLWLWSRKMIWLLNFNKITLHVCLQVCVWVHMGPNGHMNEICGEFRPAGAIGKLAPAHPNIHAKIHLH